MAVLRLLKPSEEADSAVREAWAAKEFDKIKLYLSKELGFEVEMQENGSIQVTENALEVRAALARFFDFVEAAVDNVGLVTAEVDRADAPCSKACIVEFREQQNMRRRTDLLALLKQHSTEVQFKMAIPLRNGYRARIECDCPSRRSFEAFAKSIQKIGLAREVTQDDMANAEKATAIKADALSGVKRSAATAARLAELLPGGGKQSRLRRTIGHLSEVTLFGARADAAAIRNCVTSRADEELEAEGADGDDEALSPPSRVDFPRITEICQRVADRPDEAEQSAAMLWAALSSTEGNSEVPRRQLKALTIAHELLYDDRVLAAFTEQDTEPLKGLESSSPGTLGRAAEEAMRMLAAEVRRRVEEAREKRTSRRSLTWSFSLCRAKSAPQGEAEGSPMGAQQKLQSSKSMPLEVSGHSVCADLEANLMCQLTNVNAALPANRLLMWLKIFWVQRSRLEFNRQTRRNMDGARLHYMHGPGTPWISGGSEDVINGFLTYREALTFRLRLTMLAGRPDLPVHSEHRSSKMDLLDVEGHDLVGPAVRIPLLMSDIIYEARLT
eukprot:g27879.t1